MKQEKGKLFKKKMDREEELLQKVLADGIKPLAQKLELSEEESALQKKSQTL